MDSYTVQAILTVKDQMSSAFEKAAGQTETFGRKLSRAISLGAAMQVGMMAVSKTVNTLSNHIGSAVQRYDQLNNFPKVMSNLGISAKDTRASLDVLNEGLKGLPTTLNAATSGVTRFTSKNGDIGKSTKYFLAMNNAIIAGAQPAEMQASAIEQLSQSYAKGKMDMIEWRSVSNAMPAQLKMIAKAMNMTTEELGEGLRSGTISMDDFMDTIVKLNDKGIDGMASFADQAKASTAGINTAMTNLSTSVTRGMANCLGAVDTALKNNGLPTIGESVNKFGTIVSNTFEKAAGAISKANIKGFIDGLSPSFKALKAVAEPTGKAIGKAIGFLNKHAKAVGTLVPILMGGAIALKGFFTIYDKLNALAVTPKVAESLKPIEQTARGGEGAAKKLKNALASLAKMAGVAMMIGSIALLAKSMAELGKVGNKAIPPMIALGVVIAGLAVVFDSVGTSLQANAMGIGVFAGAVSAMAITMAAVASTGTQGAVAMAAFGAVVGGLAIVFSVFGKGLNGAAVGMLAFGGMIALAGAGMNMATPFVYALAKAFPVLSKGVVSVVNAISGGLIGILNAVAGIITAVGMAAINAGMGFVILTRGVANLTALPIAKMGVSLAAVAAGVGAIALSAGGLMVAGAGMKLFSAGLRGVTKSASTASTATAKLKATFSGLSFPALKTGAFTGSLNVIKSSATAAVGTLKNAGSMGGNGYSQGMQAGMAKSMSVAKSYTSKITSTLKSASRGATTSGRMIGRGLANGMRASLGAVRSTAAQLAAAAEKAIRAKAKIHSPSRVSYGLGDYYADGWINSIANRIRDARNVIRQLVQVPSVSSPSFSFAGGSIGGSLSNEGITDNTTYVIEVHSDMDGREVAKGTAKYTKKELDDMNARDNRKKGRR